MSVQHDDLSNVHVLNCDVFVFICKYVYMCIYVQYTTQKKPNNKKKTNILEYSLIKYG